MRRVVVAFALAFALAVLSFTFAPAAPIPKEPAPIPYFPTRTGAKWVWKTNDPKETLVVTEVNKKDAGALTVTVCWEADGEHSNFGTFLVTDKGLFSKDFAGKELNPPICLLKSPPKAGDKWETRTGLVDGLFELCQKCKVLEAEWVEVPAGKFKAFPVVSEITVSVKFGPAQQKAPEPITRTEWYAPGIGLVKLKHKRGTDDEVRELQSFTPAKE
ncbi:hypothetical protein [Frigoriglobus tundricola]|uniref:Uncharacterized protein n=1 Tax=Frigoriglobus tundricola TaxID=2774151 RepID=A0A6M5YKM6_9BACT|nr:hypothetical protein [Frigoriglobus tundricola]QJW93900.1 hypothetical protein FTUN_1414 [Frigoriglobus tundricola]